MLSLRFFTTNPWIPVNYIKFPGGEIHIDLGDMSQDWFTLSIKAELKSSDDVMALFMLTDAIRRFSPYCRINLYMPYLPYARQDREQHNFAFSLKVFCDLINKMEYESVTILDCHSDVGPALLDRCRNIPVELLIPSADALKLAPGTCIVAPDQGAYKKCARVAEKLGLPLISAQKTRDSKTGKVEVSFPLDKSRIFPARVLVVDDICDGGATFTQLANQLPAGIDLRLWVTHGIFSKGLEPLKAYKEIYTANLINTELKGLETGQVQVLPYVY